MQGSVSWATTIIGQNDVNHALTQQQIAWNLKNAKIAGMRKFFHVLIFHIIYQSISIDNVSVKWFRIQLALLRMIERRSLSNYHHWMSNPI